MMLGGVAGGIQGEGLAVEMYFEHEWRVGFQTASWRRSHYCVHRPSRSLLDAREQVFAPRLRICRARVRSREAECQSWSRGESARWLLALSWGGLCSRCESLAL